MRAGWIFVLPGITLFVGSSAVSTSTIPQASSQNVKQVSDVAHNSGRMLRPDVKADEVINEGNEERVLNDFHIVVDGPSDLTTPLLTKEVLEPPEMTDRAMEGFYDIFIEELTSGKTNLKNAAEKLVESGVNPDWLAAHLKLKNPEKLLGKTILGLARDQSIWLAVKEKWDKKYEEWLRNNSKVKNIFGL